MGKGQGESCRPALALGPSLAVEAIAELVRRSAPRVARLGGWPSYIDAASLTDRVPTGGRELAPGFDAGIACALGLIPAERQTLAARLHAAYTPAAVAQVRREAAAGFPAEADTTWWLAACSVCREGQIDADGFRQQLEEFAALAVDPAARRRAAEAEFDAMTGRYWIVDGVAYGVADGCQQGAYIDGHAFAAMGPAPTADPDAGEATRYFVLSHASRDGGVHHEPAPGQLLSLRGAEAERELRGGGDIWALEREGSRRLVTNDSGLHFIGTYEETLGLEEFTWGEGVPAGEAVDEHGRERSGPVHGSRQFVKCATRAEYERAVALVKARVAA